jgi:GNAT superfamily N-acetyltransferase
VNPDGITIAEEPLARVLEDAQGLIRDHQVLVGEIPDGGIGKNWPMFHVLHDNGALQVMAARSNGRIFGYLLTTITPSLESSDTKLAVHNSFYASPEFPGLGLKIQRAALALLKDKGVNEVIWHAGVRGSGPRMGVLYKRLGAAPLGELYQMKMGA